MFLKEWRFCGDFFECGEIKLSCYYSRTTLFTYIGVTFNKLLAIEQFEIMELLFEHYKIYSLHKEHIYNLAHYTGFWNYSLYSTLCHVDIRLIFIVSQQKC